MSTGNYKHGDAVGGKCTRIYAIWRTMKARCNNPSSSGYPNYGGRGIRVCDEWMHYPAFRDWALSHGYSDDLQIDRINNDLGYCPSNCRWVTCRVNINNRRTTFRFSNGKTISEVAEELGLSFHAVWQRVKSGIPESLIVSLPKTPNGIFRKHFKEIYGPKSL